jgi:scyllo-inositol 2-dehydrogenase (NADP+)
MKKINVALVGFGLSGRYLQAPFFTTNPDFHLKTVVTSQQSLHETYPEVKRAEALAEVLSDASIDLVSISSPNNTHFDYAKQCLLAGKHVLVEKPFTATVAEAETLIELAKKAEKHLFVFQNRRFDSDFLTVRKVIENGWLGELLRLEIRFDRYKPILNAKKWKETTDEGNGILYDLGSHIIDQSIALFGAPLDVWGETYTQREGSIIDDAFDIRLDYRKLKVQLSSSLLVREPSPRYVLHGTKGSFVKYGIDVQEDHLKAGMLPGTAGFGVENVDFQGVLNTERDGLAFRGKVETLRGNWQRLFQNMAEVLLRGGKPVVRLEEVLAQLAVVGRVMRR